MKNIIKAAVYMVIGWLVAIVSMIGMAYMHFSSKFMPVYVGNTYVLVNRIIRYALYIILIILVILGVKIAVYGFNYLSKRIQKRRRR